MIEKIKSWLLGALIILSLLQTYQFVYQTPQFETLNETDYVTANPTEVTQELEKLISPRTIVAHLGERVHSVFYPNTNVYTNTLKTWQTRTFEGINKSQNSLEQFWKNREERMGMELQFKHAIPLEILSSLLKVRVDEGLQDARIDTVYAWLPASAETVEVWLISQTERLVYNVQKHDLNKTELVSMTSVALNYPPYEPLTNQHFIPSESIAMSAYTLRYENMGSERLSQGLFIDPNITRNFTEKSGTIIYTDGKRGLQLKNNKQYVIYSDPVAQLDKRVNWSDSVNTGVQFMNSQVGWNGNYLLHGLRVEQDGAAKSLEFRQYYGSFPLIEPQVKWFGYTKITMKNGVVEGFQRPLLQIKEELAKPKKVKLIGGALLLEKLKPYLTKTSLTAIYPAYLAKVEVDQKSVTLEPAWWCEFTNGQQLFIR